ncbi:MAG: response regulator, partial [Acidimicrobiales bacterium]
LADNPNGNLTDRQVEFARSIRDAGNDLLSLISDILDLSKVEAGKMDIGFAPVRPADLCDELDQMFRPIAEQQDLVFAVDVSPDAPGEIVTDSRRVQQILKNLLSNACKFTEKGSVRLSVKPAAPGDLVASRQLRSAPSVVAFLVADTGIGIDSDTLLVIFEAFQQADGTTSRRYGGTGLGLSISREIARLLGGEIHVTSEPGRGSTFTLLLPTTMERPAAAKPVERAIGAGGNGELRHEAVARAADTAAVVAGRRVLIVDDDVRNVYALTSVLEDYGLEVLCAHDGREGVDLLRRNPGVDLVLMDIMMPEMDGYETMRAIREQDGFRDLPIIALTAKAMRGDREKSLAAGASDYITKPVEPDHLLEVMRVWLYR